MSGERPVLELSRAEVGAAHAQTLADAFQDDPALAWIVPEPTRRRRMLPQFFAIMLEQSLRHGKVLSSPEGDAVSLWYPPGVVRDTILAAAWDNLRLTAAFRTTLPRGLKVAESMHAKHPKPQPHFYLRYIGVAPSAQGKGWGGALIRKGISLAQSNGLGILLETAKESNVSIYTRLGFGVTEEWHVAGGGPKFWTMVRQSD